MPRNNKKDEIPSLIYSAPSDAYSDLALKTLARGDYTQTRQAALASYKRQQARQHDPVYNPDLLPRASQTSQPVPELKTSSKNLREQGYPGSGAPNAIDFDTWLSSDPMWLSSIDQDSNYRKEQGKGFFDGSFTDIYFPTKPATWVGSGRTDADYYKEFGMSKNEVLDQYERYLEDKERESREAHPYLSLLKDFTTAPQRALQGMAAGASQLLFPNSDLANYLNSDESMRDVKAVQKERDYVQNSNKLSDATKNFSKFLGEAGDTAINWAFFNPGVEQAGSASALGGYNPLTKSTSAIIADNPIQHKLLNALAALPRAGAAYGTSVQEKRHELENAGIDPQSAYERAQSTGLVSGLTSGLMAATGGVKTDGGNAVLRAFKQAGKMGLISGAGQGAEEIADQLYLDNQGTFDLDVQNYMAQGMSEEDAKNSAAINLVGRVLGAGATGAAIGGISSLAETGLGNLFNRNNASNLNEVNGFQKLLTQAEDSDIPRLVDNGIPAVTGEQYPALPQLNTQPSVIPMPGTNGVIALEDLAPKSAPISQEVTTALQPLQGEALAVAKDQYNKIRVDIRNRRDAVATMKETLKPTKANNAKIRAAEKEIRELEKQSTALDRQINGKPTPIREQLSQADRDSLFNYKAGGIDTDINYAVKYAGDSAEAKALSKDLKKLVKDFVESGDSNELDAIYNKAQQLDELARTTNAEYSKSVSKFYDDYFGDTSLGQKIVTNSSLGKAYALAQKQNSQVAANSTGLNNTPKITEAVGESAPTSPKYTPSELKEINDYINQKQQLNNAIQTGLSTGMSSDEFMQMNRSIWGMDEYMQQKYPDLFENGNFVGTPETASESVPNNTFLNDNDIDDYLRSGKHYHVKRGKAHENGTSIIVRSEEELRGKIHEIINYDGSASDLEDVGLMRVSENIANQLKGLNDKVNADKYFFQIVPQDLRHAYNSHKIPKEKNDLPMDENDIVYALSHLNDGNVVEVKEYSDGGRRAKIIVPGNDGDYYSIHVISKKDGALALKNLWKSKKGSADTTGSSSKENLTTAHSGTTFNTNIPQNGQNVNNQSVPFVPDQGYWLRVLGDEEFLMQEAQKAGYDPQTLKALAEQYTGLSSGTTPPPSEVPHVENPDNPTKTSKYYGSTMRNAEPNNEMDDSTFHFLFDENDYQYMPKTEKQSIAEGREFIRKYGAEKAAEELLKRDPDVDGTFKQFELDAAHMLAAAAENRARELEAQGMDALEQWRLANKLHSRIQDHLTLDAQGLQANKKWKTNSARGLMDEMVIETRKAIDKNKTPGYSNMVNHLADNVGEAVETAENREDLIKKIHEAFAKNREKNSYKTDKYEQQVLDFIDNPKSKQKSTAELAEEVAKLIKKKMGVPSITTKDERAILDLLENATQYEVGSRAYYECVGRAMALYDSKIPASVPNMIKSVLYDNMLMSLKTMVSRNFMGNVGENVLENIATPFQVGADALMGQFTKGRTRTFSGNALKEGAKGFGKGAKDWWLDIIHGVNTPRSGQDTVEDIFRANQRVFKTQSDNKVIKTFMNILNGYDKTVKKGMEVGDRLIYEAKFSATRAELYDVVEKYGDAALRRGLPKGKEYSTEDLIDLIATREALESVLQNDSLMKQGAVALKEAFKKTSEDILGFDIASTSIVPFVEVPANKASRFFQFTPFGFVRNVALSGREKLKYGAVNQRRASGEAGRNAVGLLGAAAIGAGGKYISDKFSDDKEEKKVQQLNGYQEYAIQNPEGDWQMDVSDMSALPMYSKILRNAYDEEGLTGALKAVPYAAGASTLDSLYAGINKVAGTNYSVDTSKNLFTNAKDAILSSGSMLIPQLVRQTAQFTDPYKRDLGEYGSAEYDKNLVINGIPVLRQMMLSPKIDTSGNIVPELGGATGIQRFLQAYVAPYKISHPNAMKSERVQAADRIKEATGGESKAYPGIIDKGDVTGTKGYNKDNYKHEDKAALEQEVYKRSDELSNVLLAQDWFNALDPSIQGKFFNDIDSASKALGKENLVRKGKTEEEIANSDLYEAGSTVKKLTNILRNDDANHTQMLEFFKDELGRMQIKDEYGLKMNRDEYEKHKDDPTYAQDKAAAKQMDMNTKNYRKVYDYADEKGVSSSVLDNDLPVLHDLGITKQSGYYNYVYSKKQNANLTPEEFYNMFNTLDADNSQKIAQKEMFNYFDRMGYRDNLAQAQALWKAYYSDKTVPYITGNNTWGAKEATN